MKNAYALVIACILFLTFICMPFTGVFADSDPGISRLVLNALFAWYTDTPNADENGYLTSEDFVSAPAVSNGAAITTTLGDAVYLYQAGDYYSIDFDGLYWSDFNTPLIAMEIIFNENYLGAIDEFLYQFYMNDQALDALYMYQTVVTFSGTNCPAMIVVFEHTSLVYNYSWNLRISYNGTASYCAPFAIRLRGYRNTLSSGASYTEAQMLELQNQFITSMNMARLLDAIGSDDSDIDLTTIENALASMDAKLTTIISNTDDIESLLSDVNTALSDQYDLIQLFYQNVIAQYDLSSNRNLFNNQSNYLVDDSDTVYYLSNGDNSYTQFNDLYISLGVFNINSFDGLYIIYIPTQYTWNSKVYSVEYYRDNTTTYTKTAAHYHECVVIPSISSGMYVVIYDLEKYEGKILHLHISHVNGNYTRITNNLSSYYYTESYTVRSGFERIVLYLRQLLRGSESSSVTDDITSTAAELDQEAQSVESFESTYQTQLQGAHDDVDLTEYPINATNGMTYLQTYTNRAFVASNGFRVFIIYPIIFVLIGIFLRRFV